MSPVMVTGRFVDEEGVPIEAMVRFQPSVPWVDEGDVSYATLCPEVTLVNGKLVAYVTRTDTGELPWSYHVVTPAGCFDIEILEDGPINLKKLISHA